MGHPVIYLTNCSPEVTAFFSLSSTSSSSSTGSSSLSLLSFSSNFLVVSFLAGLPRGRVPGVVVGVGGCTWGWVWPIIVENYQKLVKNSWKWITIPVFHEGFLSPFKTHPILYFCIWKLCSRVHLTEVFFKSIQPHELWSTVFSWLIPAHQ